MFVADSGRDDQVLRMRAGRDLRARCHKRTGHVRMVGIHRRHTAGIAGCGTGRDTLKKEGSVEIGCLEIAQYN